MLKLFLILTLSATALCLSSWPNPTCNKIEPDADEHQVFRCVIESDKDLKIENFEYHEGQHPANYYKHLEDYVSTDFIPNGIFDIFTNVEVSEFGYGITKFQPNVFHGANHLKKIVLYRYNITELEDDTFKGAENLEEIIFSEGKIHKISKNAFRDLTKLNVIEIKHNKIDHIDPETFTTNTQLKKIRFEWNKIHDISFIEPLVNLESIKFSRNQISQIDVNVFKNMKNLQTIDFSYNFLTSFNFDEFPIQSITHLVLVGNELSEISVNGLKTNFPALEKLEVASNKLSCQLLETIKSDVRDVFYTSHPYVPRSGETYKYVSGIPCK